MSAASDRMAKDIGTATRTIAEDAKDTAQAELAALREKVEALMTERVAPAVYEVAGQAEDLVHSAADTVRQRAGQFAGTVRDQPFVAVGAAALAGIAVFGSQFGIAHHYGAQAEAAQLAQRAAQQRLASRQAVEPAAA